MSKKTAVTSLVCLAKGLTGKYIVVDLRNDASVNGRIEEVDNSMNITMTDALFTDAVGNEFYYDLFFIKERNVRYIHIQPEEDINQLILKSLEKLTRRPQPVMTLKTSRLMQRQLETLQRVEEIKRTKLKMKEERSRSEN